MLTAPNGGSDPVKEMMAEIHEMMNDKTVDMSVVVQRLGRMGLGKLAQLAMLGSNERIQLDAAKTLADRSPETAGMQKIQVDGLSISSLDAKALAEAMIESARLRAEFEHIAKDGLVEVDITQDATTSKELTDGVPALSAPQREAPGASPEGQGADSATSEGRQLKLLKE